MNYYYATRDISYKVLIDITIHIIMKPIGCSFLIWYGSKHTMYMHI